MVKARKPGATPDLDAVAKFGKEADTGPKDPNAPRNFKALRLPFNEYEWNILEEGCEITRRSKLNLLREALIVYVTDQRETP